MTAGPQAEAARGRGLVSRAISAAGAWLLEPAEAGPGLVEDAPQTPRPVIAVFGLARACGGTVVARALAAELAARDTSGTAAVACEARAAGIPLATRAASALARALDSGPAVATRAVGRLCLVEGPDQIALADSSRRLAPLVLDAGSRSLGGVPASVADRTVLVTTPEVEPALSRVAVECLVRTGVEPTLVINRVRGAPLESDDEAMSAAPCALALPDARMGAQLALGGREARGELGRAISDLADYMR